MEETVIKNYNIKHDNYWGNVLTFNDRITEAKLSNEIKQLKCGFDPFVVIGY